MKEPEDGRREAEGKAEKEKDGRWSGTHRDGREVAVECARLRRMVMVNVVKLPSEV